MQVSWSFFGQVHDAVISVSSADHVGALFCCAATADSGGSWGVLHLQRGPEVHVQVPGAKQSGGDHRCCVWFGLR